MPARSVLVVVEPSLIEEVSRYLTEPRKRVTVALELAEAMAPGPTAITRKVALATGVSARLDSVARLRDRAIELADASSAAEYASALWRELACMAAITGPRYDQGIGRSLGLLAYPEAHALASASKSTRHLLRAIRYLVQSTSKLAPALAFPDFNAALPAAGGAGHASGHIPREFVAWFSELLTGEHWPLRPLAAELFGPRSADEWRAQAFAAARDALLRRGHLLELDPELLRARRRSSGTTERAIAAVA